MTYKYIAFMGGGARGIVYPGAYKSLVDSGLYKNIEGIAGSSIGAISSAIMASGATPEQFKKIFDHTNFSKLVSKDGQLFLNFFKERIKDNILYFFKEHKISTEQDFNTNKEFLKNKDQLKEIFIKCKKNKSITFKDLNILHKIDPTLFKNLSVNAVVKNTGKNKIFNHKNTPNIEISRACLASGALPGIFNPVTIDNCEYVDGGVYENLPASPEYFSDNKNKQVSQNEILMMTLARKKGPMHTAIHSNPNETKKLYSEKSKDKYLKDFGMDQLGIKRNYTYAERKNAMYNKVRLYNQHAVELNITNIGTRDFKESNKNKDLHFYTGYFNTYDSLIKKSVCPKPNNQYDLRKFFYNVYNKYKNDWHWWGSKYGRNSTNRKTRALLQFCSPDFGKINEEQLIKGYIKLACFGRRSKQYKSNTGAASALIDKINSAPIEMKEKFCKVLNISKETKVTSDHFDQFIDNTLEAKNKTFDDKSLFYKNITNLEIKSEPKQQHQVVI